MEHCSHYICKNKYPLGNRQTDFTDISYKVEVFIDNKGIAEK